MSTKQTRAKASEHILCEQKWKSLQRYGTAQARKMGIRTEEDVNRIIQEFRKEQRTSKRRHK